MTPATSQNRLPTIGWWTADRQLPAFSPAEIASAARRMREPAHVVREGSAGRVGVGFGGRLETRAPTNGTPTFPLLATLPPVYPEWLGDRTFGEVHGVRFPYVAGAMANGIATTRLVTAMARAGMLGFFGAAGLSFERVEAAVHELERELGGGLPWGANLIHSPNEPDLEARVADLYIRRGVARVSASAYMALGPAVVRYSAAGLSVDPQGRIIRRHHVFAKVSRPEVARRFMSPAPADMLRVLVAQGHLSPTQAKLAERVPVAEDVTVEADSGGHTDNRPLAVLFPLIARLRDEIVAEHGYARPVRVGASGGIGTPQAVAAAFQLGAAYVLTGSVNQAAVESGLSADGKAMLAEADPTDVIMAPAADMFELGVRVQVLKRGTMFGTRARRLYEVYNTWPDLESIPAHERTRLERTVLGASVDEVWSETRDFWARRDPSELERAEADPRHRMALCFRWYLGSSSRWAIEGETARRLDYQVWCGPAMGAFNAWTAGTFLARPEHRTVVQVALNLLEGAAVITRAHQLRTHGVAVPEAAFRVAPRPLA